MEGKELFLAGLIYFSATWYHGDANAIGAIGEVGAHTNKRGAELYLEKYFYADAKGNSIGKHLKPKEYADDLKDFQKYAGVKPTGRLDGDTISKMMVPRCGDADPKVNDAKLFKRFELQGSKWRKSRLTWQYDNKLETKDLSRSTVLRIFREAFKLWERRTNVEFAEVNSNDPDIWLKFDSAGHGDNDIFDGKGGTLAHAYFPGDNRHPLAGDIHFDDAETFTDRTSRGTNLLSVATHEIGHSLGLSHSELDEAVMYAFESPYRSEFDLNIDDVFAIQQIYGVAEKGAPPVKCENNKGWLYCRWKYFGYCDTPKFVGECCHTCQG